MRPPAAPARVVDARSCRAGARVAAARPARAAGRVVARRAPLTRLARAAVVLVLAAASACSPARREAPPARTAPGPGHVGVASWYGAGLDGRRTASGERFDRNDFTAAHRSLPLGTRVRVTNLANGRSVVVRINDRGPFARGRLLDLSYGAARALGMERRGTGRVRVEVLGAAPPRPL